MADSGISVHDSNSSGPETCSLDVPETCSLQHHNFIDGEIHLSDDTE